MPDTAKTAADRHAPRQSSGPADWQTHTLPIIGRALPWLEREWILANGTGAYAMGTLPGVNTRRYHGLLVAATRPPVGRIVALNQLYEQLNLGEGQSIQRANASDADDDATQRIELTTCHFQSNDGAEIFTPGGHSWLRRFTTGLAVSWQYHAHGVTITRQLTLHDHAQAATILYRIEGLTRHATLRVGPMLTLRDFHAVLDHVNADEFGLAMPNDQTLTVFRHDVAATFLAEGMQFKADPQVWYGIHYACDAQRGQEAFEDHFVPGCFEAQLTPRRDDQPIELTLTVNLGQDAAAPQTDMPARRTRLDKMIQHLPQGFAALGGQAAATRMPTAAPTALVHQSRPEAGSTSGAAPSGGAAASAAPSRSESQRLRQALAIAADDFVVDRTVRGQKLSTILAGYPWFADWGRDTFISLPGLLLCTGRLDEARNTLRCYAQAISGGRVPNRFDDYDDQIAHYNTVDGSMWFVHSALRYAEAVGNDTDWNDWLADAVMDIIDHYAAGTEDHIRMEDDGLIAAGSPGTQLTWMDAKCGDTVFTPRHGKAVEINALWYSTLTELAEKLEGQSDKAKRYKKLANQAKKSFVKAFWREDLGYLIDHIWQDDHGDWHPDTTLRPNQIFAISLPRSPLAKPIRPRVLEAVRNALLTPYGLRTLPPEDPNYHAHYHGDQFSRDAAYHRGTIWPWLIGPYAEAVLRTGGFTLEAKTEAAATIAPLVADLLGRGLGQLHEIHEAEPPHRPDGCIAQAWSVAETLRVLALIETEGEGWMG